MIQKRTFEGRWWLPGTETDSTPGILEFDPLLGITLSLRRYRSRPMLEVLQNLTGDREINAPLVIFGRDTDDTPITVYRCVGTTSNSASGMEGEKYIADAIFIGAHMLDPNQEMFGSVQLEFDYLYVWLGQRAKITFAPQQKDYVINKVIELPEPIELHLPMHGMLQLRTSGGSGVSEKMDERLDTTRWSSRI